MNAHTEVVTDPEVIAKLPDSVRLKIEWHWFWFRDLLDMWRGRGPRFGWRITFLPHRTRMMNAETFWWGPLWITRPMPWLLVPTMQAHPEAFAENVRELRS